MQADPDLERFVGIYFQPIDGLGARSSLSPVLPGRMIPGNLPAFISGSGTSGIAGSGGAPAFKAGDASIGRWTIEIVKRSNAAKGFKLSPPAGSSNEPSLGSTATVVLQGDFEATIASAKAAWLMIASVKLLARRLARAMIAPKTL